MSEHSAAAVPLSARADTHASEVARGDRFEFGEQLGELPVGARRGTHRLG